MTDPRGEVPTTWTTGWTDALETGTWRSAVPEHAWRPAPCHAGCPVGGAIPEWIGSTAAGDHRDAWLQVVENNPFPAVTGRVCHRPCEADCNRRVMDEEPVSIRALERFLGDRALERGWELPGPGSEREERVVVVGGGPAGLACAYHLRRLGLQVTLFEARSQPGGLLRHGIPAYRLPEGILDAEIDRILDLGIELRTESPVSGEAGLAELEEDFDAIFVAVGAGRARRLPGLDDDAAHRDGNGRLLDGLTYLERASSGDPPEPGPRLAVVGGGSSAVDVARTARRLGREVCLIAVEARDQMPALDEEVTEALEEGIRLLDGAMVESIDSGGDGLTLSCREATLDPDAPPGEVRPVPVEGTVFTLEVDGLVVSIGQELDPDGPAAALAADRSIVRTDDDLATSRPRVFAGGDAVTRLRFVSEALGDGRRAARAIAARLGVDGVRVPRQAQAEEAVGTEEVNPFYFDPVPRTDRRRRPADERIGDFREVVQGLAPGNATGEAGRCFSCGTCIACDNCVSFCPDLAVRKNPGGDQPYRVLLQYCKGCGLCVAECPCGAVTLRREVR